MSSQVLSLETKRDRYARTADFHVESKVVKTPNFCTMLKSTNPDEFDLLTRIQMRYNPQHLGTAIIRLFDIDSVLLPHLNSLSQRTLSLSISNTQVNNFIDKGVLLIDPALEHLSYEPKINKFKASYIPKVFRTYARECEQNKESNDSMNAYYRWKQNHHNQFWNTLNEDPKKRDAMLGEVRDIELRCRADILLPPVPLILNNSLLKISKDINRTFREISRFRAECATYFSLTNSSLKDSKLIDEVLQYILYEDKSNLTVFKFKNISIERQGALLERENFTTLLRTLSNIKQDDHQRTFMLLESSYGAFPAAVAGFDIVSTSMNGIDGDISFGTDKYGKYYDPQMMVHRTHDEVGQIFQNNNKTMPCYCEECVKIHNFEDVDQEHWNVFRRSHYVLIMNEFMMQIDRAITEGNTELARDKLARSDIRNLTDLIPRY